MSKCVQQAQLNNETQKNPRRKRSLVKRCLMMGLNALVVVNMCIPSAVLAEAAPRSQSVTPQEIQPLAMDSDAQDPGNTSPQNPTASRVQNDGANATPAHNESSSNSAESRADTNA